MSTLAALRDLLRDESRWPEDFHFNYGEFETCAIGLAVRTGLVKQHKSGNPAMVDAAQFGIDERTYWAIFVSGGFKRVTAAVVAERIDAYLLNHHPHPEHVAA
jgi:hypothetical protein